jgi:hypothetical protein
MRTLEAHQEFNQKQLEIVVLIVAVSVDHGYLKHVEA